MEQNFSKIKTRIIKFLKNKGISKRAFYQRTGISNGVLDKPTGLTEDNIEKFISAYKEVNPAWVITGEGDMLVNDSDYNILKEPETEYNVKGKKIPLVKIEAMAGFGSTDWSIQVKDIQDDYVVPDFNGIDFMIKVKGESMQPKYNSGDIVGCRIIRESKFVQWNKPYVVATKEQGIIVKRLHPGSTDQSLKAVSDNPDYPPFEIPREEITGVALIIGVIRLE